MNSIKILAHRGYLVNGEPENSIPAFQTAIHHGADGFEFDVQLTSDNKFVCFHDDTLKTLGRPEARLEDLPFKELTSIELKEGIVIPSLEEVFGLFGNKVMLNVEVKSHKKGVKELVEIIHQFNLTNDPTKVIVSSFHHNPLKEIKTIDPDIPTGLLCHFPKNQVRVAKELDCDAFHPYYDTIPKKWVKFHSFWITNKLYEYYAHKSINKAQKLGLLVNPWTVNDEKYLRAVILRQVNSIITDDVEKALKLRNHFS